MSNDVAIVGIGMHKFGRTEGVSGMEQGAVAVREACKDAGVDWSDIEFAFGGSAAAGAPDTMVSQLGLTGVQFINVANGCATGGSALFSAVNTIKAGVAELGIAIGFDKHERGAFRVNTKGAGLSDWYGASGMALTTQFFGMKINRYMEEYGISHESLARVSAKAFRNGAKNPMAWRRKELSEAQVLEAAMLSYPLTQYMFCSPGEGGVAMILAPADKAHKYTDKPVFLKSAVVRSRKFGSFEVMAPHIALEHNAGPTVDASKAAFEMAGMGPDDIDIAQLQDTESGAEIMHMAENGFCEHGEQERMLAMGETEIDGRLPINTDGGCLANGEPVGASGLRQVYENVLQLRGEAGARQVPNDPKTAYTHVYGAPGISGVTILSR
ncbi:thiolase family protein [Ilumatobacter coccineus]|jgi:acetyl-CoA acetyltransferase|uniref:Putative lipid-transfer protein n=1 Tax=Ilumatobacter coccineus (strain NBRC 103263 / KCTC 29153 / YM16-304) TaxID=1313172 RepID=A0A6C7EES8_ILUCY|nr:thiolase family protein [Ilumatobacter coccineus]BAN03128.1 putative lipid-transfer protein [Ilumatobacter coccineus YM16-304]